LLPTPQNFRKADTASAPGP